MKLTKIFLMILFVLSFSGCSEKQLQLEPIYKTTTITKTVIKSPKLPTFKYPIKPIITLKVKGDSYTISKKDLAKIKEYCNKLYYRFDKLNKVNRMLNKKYYGKKDLF